MNGTEDRRRHARYRLGVSAYAVARSGSECIGAILDISHGGLAFQHLDEGRGTPDGQVRVDLMSIQAGFVLKDVPCAVVCSSCLPSVPFSSIPVKRVGLAFEKIEEGQMAAIANLVECYGRAEA